MNDDESEWVAIKSQHRLQRGMFVAQVVGKSMEPVIWQHAEIRLLPANPEFSPIVLTGKVDSQVSVVAEFVEVL